VQAVMSKSCRSISSTLGGLSLSVAWLSVLWNEPASSAVEPYLQIWVRTKTARSPESAPCRGDWRPLAR
jgi:hypothetical protein